MENKTEYVNYYELINKELERLKRRKVFHKAIADVFTALAVAAAIAVLASMLWLPVLQINGTSMDPTLTEGEYVLAVKSKNFSQGDVAAFYYNNQILVKRVIAQGGDTVDISEDGTVSVNGEVLTETLEKSFGECDIELPFTVPEGKWFVMGDHRATSLDSRTTLVGTVSAEQIVGKVLFIMWPFDKIGAVQ